MDMNFAINMDGICTFLKPPEPEYNDMLGFEDRSGMAGGFDVVPLGVELVVDALGFDDRSGTISLLVLESPGGCLKWRNQ